MRPILRQNARPIGLDHSSLAVTTVYLRRLEGQADGGWAKVAQAIGA